MAFVFACCRSKSPEKPAPIELSNGWPPDSGVGEVDMKGDCGAVDTVLIAPPAIAEGPPAKSNIPALEFWGAEETTFCEDMEAVVC